MNLTGEKYVKYSNHFEFKYFAPGSKSFVWRRTGGLIPNYFFMNMKTK